MTHAASLIRTERYAGAGISLCGDVGGDPSAPAVILLHGGGQTRHSWRRAQHELIEQGFYVISLDARGHGDSDWPADADYTFKSQANDLRAVIATLPRLPALVGASMGGATALYLIGNSPEPIASALVMVDVVPRIEAEGSKKIREFMGANPQGFASLEEAADAVAAYYPTRKRPKDPSGLMKNLRLRDDGRLHWHWDPRFISSMERAEPPEMGRFMLAACRGVHVPTLLVRGMESDIVGQAGVEEFRQLLPQLQVADVAGAGHMVAGDRNDAFNKSVVDFLRGLPHG
ncbi:MAG: Pimeloyl-ACP methyl ester carboxylesterase [Hydrocarboniphaga sp.]|uniref:alpha/beta fold hydrolase n=1 Tax=Hydrocarboniphaga sp. TaxID=2033016 RepID=UPI00262AE2C9|nr:alpha/beta hydrolase [Hydrocarboniphaga sp.]MDB5968435.1 Pimeloyl-ACP methyl ester carboxylesterase [Hydrocarboniphaga sp.]